MHLVTKGATALALATMAAVSAAQAGGEDRVYADNYGNLVIESAAGYKRILVGEGSEADRVASYIRTEDPGVIYADGHRTGQRGAGRDCWRPPVLVKGRSYMFGFDQGEIPLQGGPCR